MPAGSEPQRLSFKHLSKLPSWCVLSFILGALFVWLLPQPKPKPAPPPPPRREPPTVVTTRLAPDLSVIEAVFAQWQRGAVWQDGRTEVALWDNATHQYSQLYEIIRRGGHDYFRSIDHLTRPVLTHGVSEGAPLLFTGPEAAGGKTAAGSPDRDADEGD